MPFCMGQLRHESYAGIDCATGGIMGDRYPELVRNDTAELFFTDQFRESLDLVAEGPYPFTPEQHALDIVNPVRLHMLRQKLVKYPEFMDLHRADVDSGQAELFAKPVQHLVVCLVHERRREALSFAHGPVPGKGALFHLRPEYDTCSLTLRSGHGKSPAKHAKTWFIDDYLKNKI
jgi:hypothetical protein